MRTGDIHRGRTFEAHGRGMYLVALALTLVAMAACGAQARGRASAATTTMAATTTATATATPAPSLPFRHVALPPGVDPGPGSVTVSPVDGKVAWVCLASGPGSFRLWVTTDEGSTWHAAGQLHPATPQEPTYSCRIIPDQSDAQAAVFEVTWGSGEACTLASMSFYTRDTGQHWQQLPGWTAIMLVSTYRATVYAILTIITPFAGQSQSALLQSVSPPRLSAPGPCPAQQTQGRSGFMVSSDGLYTWRELHPGGSTTQDPVYQFWHSPASGELFAATYSGAFWHSVDGGASWIQLKVPGMQISIGMWLASRKAWMFCGWQGQGTIITCSTDTGTTWQHPPALTVTFHVRCDTWCHQKGGQDSQTSTCPTFALEADGSLLATCPLNNTDTGPTFMMYRLSPGAVAWVALGTVPSQSCSVSANGIMWCPDTGGWETVALPA